jgi:phage/plasmid-associated DNA primase
MKYGAKFLKSIQEFYRDFLPSYTPNYDYVEFEDRFYRISSGECLKVIDDDIRCFRYFPCSLLTTMDKTPTLWLEVLANSLSHGRIREFCIEYSKLFRGEKKRRESCIFLVGESGSGKSSLLAPLEGIFGRDEVGICSRVKQSPLEDLVGKRMAVLDEFSTSLIPREELLLLTEGQSMKISMKYRRNPRINQPMHLIFSSNFYPSYSGDESGALESRLSIYHFHKLKTQSSPSQNAHCMATIKEQEAASVLLYCNKIYLESNKDQ